MQQHSVGLKITEADRPKGTSVVDIVQTCSMPTEYSLTPHQRMRGGCQGMSCLVQTSASEIPPKLDRRAMKMEAILCMTNNNYALRSKASLFYASALALQWMFETIQILEDDPLHMPSWTTTFAYIRPP